MATAPDNPPAEPTQPAAETRELDPAAGGGTVPVGPLGGPEFKTNDQLNAERIVAEEKRAAEEKAAALASVNPLA